MNHALQVIQIMLIVQKQLKSAFIKHNHNRMETSTYYYKASYLLSLLVAVSELRTP